jgi:hypothetical protein
MCDCIEHGVDRGVDLALEGNFHGDGPYEARSFLTGLPRGMKSQ